MMICVEMLMFLTLYHYDGWSGGRLLMQGVVGCLLCEKKKAAKPNEKKLARGLWTQFLQLCAHTEIRVFFTFEARLILIAYLDSTPQTSYTKTYNMWGLPSVAGRTTRPRYRSVILINDHAFFLLLMLAWFWLHIWILHPRFHIQRRITCVRCSRWQAAPCVPVTALVYA